MRCSRRQLSVIQRSSLCVSVRKNLYVLYCCLSKSHKQKKNSSMSKASFKIDKGESRSRYRLRVPPCPRYITSGDTHSLCVVCLGVNHAELALEGAGCPHCERLPLRKLRSRRVLFEEGAFASISRGAGPTSAERTDNTAVVSYINHQGGLRSRPFYKLAHQILVWSQISC